MLEPDQWDEVISKLQGVVYRGTERLASSVVMDALGVEPTRVARSRQGKPVSVAMRRWGWVGPKSMRIVAGVTVTGYWRSPNTPPRAIDLPDVPFDDAFDADDLPHQLETLTRHSLKELRRILRLPLDQNNGNLLRAKVTAALGVLQGQLRADNTRMRVRVADDVLTRLEKLVREQRKLLPKQDHSTIDATTGELIVQSVEPNSAT